jgi:hypothetical protein
MFKLFEFKIRHALLNQADLGPALFNQEGNFWGVPCSIKKATFGACPVQSRRQLLGRAPFNQEGKFEQIIVTNPLFSHPTLCETTRPFLIQPFVKQPALSSSSLCETTRPFLIQSL